MKYMSACVSLILVSTTGCLSYNQPPESRSTTIEQAKAVLRESGIDPSLANLDSDGVAALGTRDLTSLQKYHWPVGFEIEALRANGTLDIWRASYSNSESAYRDIVRIGDNSQFDSKTRYIQITIRNLEDKYDLFIKRWPKYDLFIKRDKWKPGDGCLTEEEFELIRPKRIIELKGDKK